MLLNYGAGLKPVNDFDKRICPGDERTVWPWLLSQRFTSNSIGHRPVKLSKHNLTSIKPAQYPNINILQPF